MDYNPQAVSAPVGTTSSGRMIVAPAEQNASEKPDASNDTTGASTTDDVDMSKLSARDRVRLRLEQRRKQKSNATDEESPSTNDNTASAVNEAPSTVSTLSAPDNSVPEVPNAVLSSSTVPEIVTPVDAAVTASPVPGDRRDELRARIRSRVNSRVSTTGSPLGPGTDANGM